MSTYRAQFKSFTNQGLSVHFSQSQSQTIIKCNKPSPCSYPEAQAGLYLDISLRENSKNQQNWTSFENHLKELFDQVVQLQQYPNSSIKISIFILEEGSNIKACIINGLWLLLLKLGVNMKKSIYCSQQSLTTHVGQKIEIENATQQESRKNCVVYNLNDPQSVIEGEMRAEEIRNQQQNYDSLKQQLSQYKNFVLQTIKFTLFV